MPRDRAYYGLSKNDKVLHICGVPLSYLKKLVSPQQLNFEMLALTNTKPAKTITPKDQHDVFQELLQNHVHQNFWDLFLKTRILKW